LLYRERLIEQLSNDSSDVVLIAAPTGYGKTTTLVQWASVSDERFTWLTLRPEDSDPRKLIVDLAASIAAATSRDSDDVAMIESLDGDDLSSQGVGRLGRMLADASDRVSIIIDNGHLLRTASSEAVIAQLIDRIAPTHRLVLATRSTPKLPLAHLKSQGRLLDITEDDLAFARDEIARLMGEIGAEGKYDIDDLLEWTEGWPAVAFLLGTSHHSAGRGVDPDTHNGDGLLLREYLHTEVLGHLSKGRRDFLTMMAPLERFSAPLYEHITDSKTSYAKIEAVGASTHLIRPVDPPASWYVMNRVVRDALRTELTRTDPEFLATIHSRAAEWFEINGSPDLAIRHAREAGEMDAVARLMGTILKQRYSAGGADETLEWMRWLQAATSLDTYPMLAAIGALALAQEGEPLEADAWIDAAVKGSTDDDNPPLVWIVRALACRDGVEGMNVDIDRGIDALPPGSEWTPAALLTAGLARSWDGDSDEAEPLFIEAAAIGERNGSFPAVSLALASRALIAISRGDWRLATELAENALRVIRENKLDVYLTSGLGFAVAARIARRENDIPKAESLLSAAAAIRPRMSAAIPGVAVQTLVEMARARLELSDVVGARALLREASDIVVQRPGLGVLPDEIAALQDSMRNIGPGTVGPSALTKAELRLLPLLATNLSFPQIGEQLFISRHTVKTQAMSIYRKLGTSSRSDAVSKAYEVGLLSR
jgi:LuxR family maltose regulon positive regulatory protein